jgi:hypothetical protein
MRWRLAGVISPVDAREAEDIVEDDPQGGSQIDESMPLDGWWVDPYIIKYDVANNPNAESLIRQLRDDWDDYLNDPKPEEIWWNKIDAIVRAWESQKSLEKLPPIIVRQTGTLVDGFHRLIVAAAYGQTSGIPAIVVRW